MAPVVNARVIFNSIPEGVIILTIPLNSSSLAFHAAFPEPGKTTVYDTSEKIDVEKVPLNGGFLIKVLELSIDPYMRNRMREPSTKSYMVSTLEFILYRCSKPFNTYLFRTRILLESRKLLLFFIFDNADNE